MKETAEIITALGGFGGLAGLVTALVQLRKIKAEIMPNHGSSLADAIRRTEDGIKRLDHQMGEIRRDSAVTHELIGKRLDEHAQRLDKIK